MRKQLHADYAVYARNHILGSWVFSIRKSRDLPHLHDRKSERFRNVRLFSSAIRNKYLKRD